METETVQVRGRDGAYRPGARMIRRAGVMLVSLLALLIVMGEIDRKEQIENYEVHYAN